MAIRQRTLKNKAQATHIGLHTGRKAGITVLPAPPDTGIVFYRSDDESQVPVRAHTDNVGSTMLSTNLTREGTEISTVEHLMAAFWGLGIDNALVYVRGSEVPIMEGSAASFLLLLQGAGIVEQDAAKKFIRIRKKVSVREGDRWAQLKPSDHFEVNCSIDFKHPVFWSSPKEITVDFSQTPFSEISRARTFGFREDAERLRERSLALGASLSNTVVMDEYRVLNEEGLRCKDEFVKHKVLDIVGDLYLMGHSVIGCFSSHKPGHTLNYQLLREILADETAWEVVTCEQACAPIVYQGLILDTMPVAS